MRYKDKRCDRGLRLQSVLFSRDIWSTAGAARRWLREHRGMAISAVDAKPNTFRFRQIDPGRCLPRSFRTIAFGKGIKAVVCCPRGHE